MAYSLFTALFVLATSRVARSQLRVFRSAPTRCHRQCHSQFHRTRHIQPRQAEITASRMKVKGILFISVAACAGFPVNSCPQEGVCSGYSPAWFRNVISKCPASNFLSECCIQACKTDGCYKTKCCPTTNSHGMVDLNQRCTNDQNVHQDIGWCCKRECGCPP